MRGATVGDQVRPQSELISIHAPLAGCDIDDLIPYANNAKFQSTHPSRGATRAIWIPHSWRKYFNPRTPCGARRQIHQDHRLTMEFQSTRPMRGATNSSFQRYFFCHYFNPRAPCGARRRNCNSMGQVHKISIHAPHAGRDCQAAHREPYCTNFNPRAPCGARLDVLFLHALTRCDFNPRAPCGARRFRYVTVAFVWSFQSTRPMRGATFYILPTMRARDISIHAPRAGRDGGVALPLLVLHPISIHAPRAGRDPLSRRGSPC